MNIKNLKLIIGCFCFSFNLSAQALPKASNPLLNYLFPIYGVEESELILLKKQQIEIDSNWRILEEEEFVNRQIYLEEKISACNDEEMKKQLHQEKDRTKSFQSLELFILQTQLK